MLKIQMFKTQQIVIANEVKVVTTHVASLLAMTTLIGWVSELFRISIFEFRIFAVRT
jgi:hypothetical protein